MQNEVLGEHIENGRKFKMGELEKIGGRVQHKSRKNGWQNEVDWQRASQISRNIVTILSL